ncbi:ATP/GTP-binding protein [Actinokineospora globicatena]|uniref:ATP-binding protein n=1 Tax=Actinokineospora globicatena TaxID=103729 RepID=A0A9W6QGJ7_9PSEU|nr:ATP-binding protein [Actinokineospora globicatena]GLW90038.1 ATP-binding protein [Actinokineospora globicatena]
MTAISTARSRGSAADRPLRDRVRPTMTLPNFHDHPTLKLAVSGTFSSGKSTTSEALSVATGIPRTHAKTSRQLLVDLVPGKTVMELSAMELVKLGLRRFEERVHNESGTGPFISDGGVFHEWVYFEARMRVGINPGAAWWFQGIKKLMGLPVKHFYQRYTDTLGHVTRARAKRIYDAYVHLPVEFDMEPDGHRPVSEPFRRLSDDLLIAALEELEIPYRVVGGTVEQRVTTIIDLFGLPLAVPVPEAIEIAEQRVATDLDDLKADARYHEAQRKKSLLRQIQYAMRY